MAKPDRNNTPILEWIAAAAGAAALAVVLGVLAYEIAAGHDTPPAFEMETTRIAQAGDRWLVGFRIRNTGAATAMSVKVVGTAGPSGETSEVTLRYVPGGSTREAGLYFTQPPVDSGVHLRVLGYERP